MLSGSACQKTEKFQVNLCFETSKDNVQTANVNDKGKVVSEAL